MRTQGDPALTMLQSKTGTPISTPSVEKGSPFFAGISQALASSAKAAQNAVANVGLGLGVPTSPDQGMLAALTSSTPPRLRRTKSRSSARSITKVSPSNTPWMFQPNSHGNGGLQNAVNSVSDRVTHKLWIGVPGDQVDDLSETARESVARDLRHDHDSIPVWVPDAELKVNASCTSICIMNRRLLVVPRI